MYFFLFSLWCDFNSPLTSSNFPESHQGEWDELYLNRDKDSVTSVSRVLWLSDEKYEKYAQL